MATSSEYGAMGRENGQTAAVSVNPLDIEQRASAEALPQNSSPQTDYVAMDGMLAPPNVGKDAEDEDDKDDGMAKSVVSSVLTADGIHDVPGFYCVCLVILIGDMSRGILFPTLWPLIEIMGGNSITLGYSVAAFSFGRVIVSPLFGSYSHTIGYTKTLLIASSILLLGTLIYAQVQNSGVPQLLIVAQTCLGIGSGTLGVTRAFVADVTAKRNRTTYMAWITAVQYAGFTVTPVFGAFFSFVLHDSDFRFGLFRLNKFTAPAFFMTLTVATTIVVLLTYFQDRQRIDLRKDSKKKSQKRLTIDDAANATTFVGLTVYDCCILGCMLLNVSTKGSIACFETLGISIAQSHFNMLESKAGAFVSLCGSLGVVALLSMDRLSTIFSDVQLINGGMLMMAMGIACLTTVDNVEVNPSWKYYVAMFLIYSIGYPIGHTAVIGLFSKIVGRRPQGTLMGWFASAGSLARMFFPIMSGYIANYRDVATLFVILVFVLLTSVAFVLRAQKILSLLSS